MVPPSVIVSTLHFTQDVYAWFYSGSKYKGGTLVVPQLFEALRYKPEGRGFDSRWCHCNFSLT